MNDRIAPEIVRQRQLIEGYYGIYIDRGTIDTFFKQICEELQLKFYGEPIIFSPSGEGKEMNQGYDAFVPLIDSGISLYVWSNKKFISLIIYTCKSFNQSDALEFTKRFFEMSEPLVSIDF